MITLFLRTVIVYVLVFSTVRLMGKRQISDMQPFDLVITLLIADLASAPISDYSIPLFYGIIPILTMFILHRTVAFLSLKSAKARNAVCGHPIVVIDKGSVVEDALSAANYTLSDLTEQLRLKDVFTISAVEYAILETNGSLSVLKKDPNGAAAPGVLVIADGKAVGKELERIGLGENELERMLASNGIPSIKRCLFACFEPPDGLIVQEKKRHSKGGKALNIRMKEKCCE